MSKLIKLLFFIMLLLAINQRNVIFAKQIRRDPFVPLVDRDGNIRRGQDLFMPTEEILPKIILKGILWDENNPLAVINGKVLSEGSKIPITENGFIKIIILEKINPNNVVLNYNDRKFVIRLRKKEKE
jgi:hypothetical protein